MIFCRLLFIFIEIRMRPIPLSQTTLSTYLSEMDLPGVSNDDQVLMDRDIALGV